MASVLAISVAIGHAAIAPARKRFQPTRSPAFGPNCSFPASSACPGTAPAPAQGSTLDQSMGMYASWNTCTMPIRPARHHSLVEVARLVHPDTRWKEGFSLGWFPNRTGNAQRLACKRHIRPR